MALSGVFVIEIVLALAVDVLTPYKALSLADVTASQRSRMNPYRYSSYQLCQGPDSWQSCRDRESRKSGIGACVVLCLAYSAWHIHACATALF